MRLLIVDDEHYIVNYLSTIIEEQEITDLEIHKCYSGTEALKIAQTTLIDLVLLDIKMPGISGLEVAPQLTQLLPNCRIIFLTAYDNFNHIYESNKLERTRYLLKTEDDEVILNEVLHTLNELKAEQTQLLLLSEAQKKSFLLSHLLQQNVLQGIMAGQSINKIERELRIVGSDFQLNLQKPVYLMYTQIKYETFDEKNATNSTYIVQYLQMITKLVDGKFKFSMLDFGKGTFLLFFQPFNDASTDFEFLQSAANDFGDYFFSNYKRCVTTVLYPEFSQWDEICNHFHLMQQYVESSLSAVPIIYSTAKILNKNPLHSSTNEEPIDRLSLDRKLQELSFYLNQGSEQEFFNILNALGLECMQIRNMHNITAVKIHSSITLMLIQYIELHQLQEKIVSKIALYPLYDRQDFSSWKEIFQYLDNLSRRLFDILNSTTLDRNEQLVKKIKKYIRNHLAEALNLTTISRVVHYNEAYISRLFKQTNGMGISEYISLKRISKSKELLVSTTESMQYIATATGFDTAQYFSIVFKKTTGFSPSEYRRSHLN